tara:strand:- start:1508 stop:1804 length:297 start_codon:yes stop_codon:yes gene_type:complete
MKTYTRKIGSNRGKTRLWLEGKILEDNGWKKADRFKIIFDQGVVFCIKASDGPRKVAGTDARPIIDTNTDKLGDSLRAFSGDVVSIDVTQESIRVSKA